jgi:hypothetical protein
VKPLGRHSRRFSISRGAGFSLSFANCLRHCGCRDCRRHARCPPNLRATFALCDTPNVGAGSVVLGDVVAHGDIDTLPVFCAFCGGAVALECEFAATDEAMTEASFACPFCGKSNVFKMAGRILWVAVRHQDAPIPKLQ